MPTLNFIQVAGLFLWQQVGVGIFSGIDFVHKQGTEPAFVAALWKPPTQKQDERKFHKGSKQQHKTELSYQYIKFKKVFKLEKEHGR